MEEIGGGFPEISRASIRNHHGEKPGVDVCMKINHGRRKGPVLRWLIQWCLSEGFRRVHHSEVYMGKIAETS